MLIRQTLLTLGLFVFGSSIALADTSHVVAGHGSEGQTINQLKVELEKNPYAPETVSTMVDWTSNEHKTEARAHYEEFETLEQKIQDLNERIDRLDQKHYLDPKGFKRDNLKRIKGNLVQDLREAAVKTVWHEKQAEKVMLSEPAHHNTQQNS